MVHVRPPAPGAQQRFFPPMLLTPRAAATRIQSAVQDSQFPIAFHLAECLLGFEQPAGGRAQRWIATLPAVQKKKGRRKDPAGLLYNQFRRRPTFPRSYPRSIIGPTRLNFRVRDGNGCDPRGMTTGKLSRARTRESNNRKLAITSSARAEQSVQAGCATCLCNRAFSATA